MLSFLMSPFHFPPPPLPLFSLLPLTPNSLSLSLSPLLYTTSFFSSLSFLLSPPHSFVSTGDPLLLIRPSQPVTVSLGQRLIVNLYLASTILEEIAGPFYRVDGSGVEVSRQFIPDPLNLQHQVFEVTVTPDIQGFNELSYQIGV